VYVRCAFDQRIRHFNNGNILAMLLRQVYGFFAAYQTASNNDDLVADFNAVIKEGSNAFFLFCLARTLRANQLWLPMPACPLPFH